VASAATGQEATCWIAGVGPFEFASNAGSASVSGFVDGGSSLTPLGNTTTNGGTVDAAAAGRSSTSRRAPKESSTRSGSKRAAASRRSAR
jgi:hypothetical protein